MSRASFPITGALLAATALGGCAFDGAGTSSQTAEALASPQQQQTAARQESQTAQETGQRGRNAQAQQRQAPARIDRRARQQVEREDMLTQMAFWAGEYQTFPDDLEAAQKFSEALRKGGRNDRAAQVANQALQRFAADKPLMRTYGLAQIASNHPQEALRPLALLAQADATDWRARSALGVALDQLGRYADARRAYQEALAIRPDDAGLLTNLGMSHLMANEPADAEPILRQASALPNAPPQARQNLAIALALQGRFEEAERLERVDVPPDVAAENMTFLRSLLNDDRRWGDLRSGRS